MRSSTYEPKMADPEPEVPELLPMVGRIWRPTTVHLIWATAVVAVAIVVALLLWSNAREGHRNAVERNATLICDGKSDPVACVRDVLKVVDGR